LACYHCGDICSDDDIRIDDKYFCCQGCKFVYELLDQNNLNRYYDLNDRPGVNRRIGVYGTKYEFLDDPMVSKWLLDFSDDKIARVTFHIPQIHCSSCVWLLENLNKLHSGIPLSRIDFLKKKLSLTYIPEKISIREVVELLVSIGYEPEINLGSLEKKPHPKPKDRVYTRLAVAGFCFANIMLFSLPEYFASDAIEPKFKTFFGALKIILSLPVFFYSAAGFFKSAFNGLRQKMVNMDIPISLGIIILFGRSIFEIFTTTGAGYMDSFTGLVFFLLIGRVFQKKTYESLSFERDYKSYFPLSVTRRDPDGERTVMVSELSPGDRILVHNGELVPADSALLKTSGKFDYSFVTGEADVITKNPADFVYAGGRVKGGAVELEVLKEVSESYLAQLWNNEIFGKSGRAGIETLANKVSRYFTAAVITISLAAGLSWLFMDPSRAVDAATAVLIIACPCALALSTPFTLGTAARIFGRNGFFLKNSALVEKLSHIDTLVFDKTGTLTISGDSTVDYQGRELSLSEKQAVNSLVRQSSHPLNLKIAGQFPESDISAVSNFQEIAGMGMAGVADGFSIRMGSSAWLGADSPAGVDDNSGSRVYLKIDEELVGYFTIVNKYRQGVKGLIETLISKYKMFLLSGDNSSERKNLENIFGDKAELRFQQSPYDKQEFIEKLQASGKEVMMLGDGLNDAGSLLQSDIGVAVSENTASFSPSSDIIFDAGRLMSLARFLKLADRSMRIIKISFGISFVYNIIGLSFAVAGMITPLFSAILMPLSSISVVLFTTSSVIFSAKRLRL